jgi:hypothetical protein
MGGNEMVVGEEEVIDMIYIAGYQATFGLKNIGL